MIMEFEDPCGRGGDDLRAFSDVIGEVVQDYIGEIPSTEIPPPCDVLADGQMAAVFR